MQRGAKRGLWAGRGAGRPRQQAVASLETPQKLPEVWAPSWEAGGAASRRSLSGGGEVDKEFQSFFCKVQRKRG